MIKFEEDPVLKKLIRDYIERQSTIADQEIRTALLGSRIIGFDMYPIPERKTLAKLVILTDAKPMSLGSFVLDLSQIVLRVKVGR